MTPNERQFADEYLRNGRNGTKAYLFAYPRTKNKDTAKVRASQLRAKQEIRDYIDSRLDELSDSMIADTQEVMAFMTNVMRGKINGFQVVTSASGNAKIVETPTLMRDRIKAGENLAKFLGADKPAKEEANGLIDKITEAVKAIE